jgi:hypothetical protein
MRADGVARPSTTIPLMTICKLTKKRGPRPKAGSPRAARPDRIREANAGHRSSVGTADHAPSSAREARCSARGHPSRWREAAAAAAAATKICPSPGPSSARPVDTCPENSQAWTQWWKAETIALRGIDGGGLVARMYGQTVRNEAERQLAVADEGPSQVPR